MCRLLPCPLCLTLSRQELEDGTPNMLVCCDKCPRAMCLDCIGLRKVPPLLFFALPRSHSRAPRFASRDLHLEIRTSRFVSRAFCSCNRTSLHIQIYLMHIATPLSAQIATPLLRR